MNELDKRLKCIHCQDLVEKSGTCSCGTIILNENQIIQGKIGVDYIDYSPQLLCD